MKLCISALLASICFLLVARPVFAHTGAPLAPHDLWSAWNWDAPILLGLAATAWIYTRGLAALWRRAGGGRSIGYGQALAFHGGLLTLFVALVSPLDALSGVLFSAHMVQHLLLIVVAAPLLVWGAPPFVWMWAAPRGSRQRLARWWHRQPGLHTLWHLLTLPLMAWLLHAAALWVWHTPLLYGAALDDPLVHLLEHAGFLGAALLFWWVLLQPGAQRGLRYGTGMVMAFTTALHSGLLGTLLTFAATPWYWGYLFTTAAWGLTPLEDQQLAGVIMWAPAGLVYLGATLALLGIALRTVETDGAADRHPRVESTA